MENLVKVITVYLKYLTKNQFDYLISIDGDDFYILMLYINYKNVSL